MTSQLSFSNSFDGITHARRIHSESHIECSRILYEKFESKLGIVDIAGLKEKDKGTEGITMILLIFQLLQCHR